MTSLLVGAAIAALALLFVLWPLVVPPSRRATRRAATQSVPAPADAAVRALREIEFDRTTGKLSDTDYQELKADYTARAIVELRDADAARAAPAGGTDAAEAMIQRARSAATTCAHCSAVCTEPDAVYCSTCGGYLPGSCAKCNAPITESGARFCTSCGWELAA